MSEALACMSLEELFTLAQGLTSLVNAAEVDEREDKGRITSVSTMDDRRSPRASG